MEAPTKYELHFAAMHESATGAGKEERYGCAMVSNMLVLVPIAVVGSLKFGYLRLR
jgi:hypothetical protein